MHKCTNCGKITTNGFYSYLGTFTCNECAPLVNKLHFDVFEINNNQVVRTPPFLGATSSEERQYVISFAYNLFNNKLSPAAYPLLNKYLKKGYTYLGILQALEFFYVVKKNSIAKSKNNIGIVPYVYDLAQQFYQTQNNYLHQNYLKFAEANKAVPETQVVPIKESTKSNLIDMTEL